MESSKSESKLEIERNSPHENRSLSISRSKSKSKSKNGSFTVSKLDWNAIEVDTASSQFMKFKIELGNVLIYNGPW